MMNIIYRKFYINFQACTGKLHFDLKHKLDFAPVNVINLLDFIE